MAAVRKWEILEATKVKVSSSSSKKKKSEPDQIQRFLHKTCNEEVSGSFTLTVNELKIMFVLNYLTVLLYTKTIIYLSVGGYW